MSEWQSAENHQPPDDTDVSFRIGTQERVLTGRVVHLRFGKFMRSEMGDFALSLVNWKPIDAADLQVWHDGQDWAIAESADEAASMVAKMTGHDELTGAAFKALAPDFRLGILCVNGKPDDHGVGVRKTCAEWIAQQGKGILCSKDF